MWYSSEYPTSFHRHCVSRRVIGFSRITIQSMQVTILRPTLRNIQLIGETLLLKVLTWTPWKMFGVLWNISYATSSNQPIHSPYKKASKNFGWVWRQKYVAATLTTCKKLSQRLWKWKVLLLVTRLHSLQCYSFSLTSPIHGLLYYVFTYFCFLCSCCCYNEDCTYSHLKATNLSLSGQGRIFFKECYVGMAPRPNQINLLIHRLFSCNPNPAGWFNNKNLIKSHVLTYDDLSYPWFFLHLEIAILSNVQTQNFTQSSFSIFKIGKLLAWCFCVSARMILGSPTHVSVPVSLSDGSWS